MDNTEAIKWMMFLKNAYENIAGMVQRWGGLLEKGLTAP